MSLRFQPMYLRGDGLEIDQAETEFAFVEDLVFTKLVRAKVVEFLHGMNRSESAR